MAILSQCSNLSLDIFVYHPFVKRITLEVSTICADTSNDTDTLRAAAFEANLRKYNSFNPAGSLMQTTQFDEEILCVFPCL